MILQIENPAWAKSFSHAFSASVVGVSSYNLGGFITPIAPAVEWVECEYCGCRYQKEEMRGKPWRCWYGCGAPLP